MKFINCVQSNHKGGYKLQRNPSTHAYGNRSPKYSTSAKWSLELKQWRDSLEDYPKPGSPGNVISKEMTARVERLVLDDQRIKVAKLASKFCNSTAYGSVYTITNQYLGMLKVSARWMPRNFNMQDCQQRVESVKSSTSRSLQCQSRAFTMRPRY